MPTSAISRPRPILAAFLTLLVPGLGHLYAGHAARGAACFVAFLGAAAAMFLVMLFAPPTPVSIIIGLAVFGAFWIFIVFDAVQLARGVFVPKPYNRWYVYLGLLILFIFVIQPAGFGFVKSQWIEAFRLPTNSMAPTFLSGDYLLVRKTVPHEVRDRIVVFRPPFDDSRFYIQRAVAVSGDTIQMVNKALIRNGKRLDEPYVQHVDQANDVYAPSMYWQGAALISGDSSAYRPTRDNWGPLVVPPNHVFMLGDNRDDSEDSRYWGFVPVHLLAGYPKRIYFAYQSQIRWDRIGQDVAGW
jgi:signal peptidase I